MRRTRLVLTFALLAAMAGELPAQLIPRVPRIPGTPRTHRQRRPRFLYERPKVSPWIGGDAGVAVVLMDCRCARPWDGLAGAGTIAGGVMFYSRVTVSAEQTGMNLWFSKYNTARLRRLSVQVSTAHGFYASAGFGQARFRRNPELLIDDTRSLMLGAGDCWQSRVDVCSLVDLSFNQPGSPTLVENDPVRYRMKTIRFGIATRFHMRGGRTTNRRL